ncbi:MAG: TonB-dependent receptor, partial [Bacteroidetes bacterium]|nr:TonB-dependent receptor [Bacteroidota bacterium]
MLPGIKAFALLSFVLLTASAFPARAQNAVVRGFITDASTEQALQGASVVLIRDEMVIYGAASDGDGFFLINRIVTGSYTLRISFVGFAPFEEQLQIGLGTVIDRVTALQPREAEIDELVIEADAEGGITAVVAGLESVVPAEIARVPIPGVSGDLASYLQTIPGFVAQGDRGGQFFVRGGSADQNLAMLDGLPVYMPFHILSFYSAFPEEIVDRANVYTGGYGAQYGTRLSSIIDVHARNGNKQNLAGSIALAPFLSAARVEGPIWKNRVSVIASVRQSFIEEIFPDMFGQRMSYRFGDRFGKLHALLGKSHAFSFMVLDTDDRGDIAGTKKTFDGEKLSEAVNDSSEVAWTNRVFGGSYTYRSNRIPLVVRLTAGRSEMTSDFGPEKAPERSAEVSSTDLIAKISWLLKSGSINAGASYRKSKLSYVLDGIFEGFTRDSQNLTELDAYLEADLNLLQNRFNVNPGGHLYALKDRSRPWVDPRIRASWYPRGPDGKVQFHAAWGIYRQAVVGLSDERDLGNLFTVWVSTPDDSNVPKSVHAIAGVNLRLARWLNFAAEGYRKTYDDLSVAVFSAFPGFTTSLQKADGKATGLDLRLDLQDRPFVGESVLDAYISYA